MKSQEYLDIVTKQIHYIFDREYIEAELKEHLEDSIQDLVEEGLSYEDAEEQAVLQMGDPVETGKMLNKEHQPLLGYLWMLSKVVLVLVTIQFVFLIGINFWTAMENAQPIIARTSIASYPVNMDIDMSCHRIKIDYICEHKDGIYSMTLRAWKKFSYSRASWSCNYFQITDKEGNRLDGGGGSRGGMICSNHRKEFDWPKDNILVLNCEDGQVIELDLEVYVHE